MTHHHRVAPGFVAVVSAFALGACGKVQEAAGEKATEKMIESALSKEGTQAKVNLSEGGMKVSTTDASGAKQSEGAAMRMATSDSVSLQMGLHSDDAFDKVAAFYRDKLKAMAEGKHLTDMAGSDGASLSLVDDKTKTSLQVHVSKADKGSDIAILSIRDKTK